MLQVIALADRRRRLPQFRPAFVVLLDIIILLFIIAVIVYYYIPDMSYAERHSNKSLPPLIADKAFYLICALP